MFITIVIALLIIAAIAAFIFSRTFPREVVGRSFLAKLALIPAGLAIIALLFSSLTIVQPRTVGVVVGFGKPVAVLGNGLHVKAPWQSVEKLDGAVQNDVYSGKSAIPVRLGNNGKATVDASIQWQLKTDDAMDVFLDYRTFEGIQSNLVDRNFRASLNEVMAEYDPLNPENAAEGGQDLAGLAKKVEAKMQEKVGTQIEVRSVTLPIVNFDDATQSRINELQTETARTRVAEQKKSTSTAEAEANRILVESITPETLTSKCLDIVAESGQAPIGCFPSDAAVQPITMVGGEQK